MLTTKADQKTTPARYSGSLSSVEALEGRGFWEGREDLPHQNNSEPLPRKVCWLNKSI